MYCKYILVQSLQLRLRNYIMYFIQDIYQLQHIII